MAVTPSMDSLGQWVNFQDEYSTILELSPESLLKEAKTKTIGRDRIDELLAKSQDISIDEFMKNEVVRIRLRKIYELKKKYYMLFPEIDEETTEIENEKKSIIEKQNDLSQRYWNAQIEKYNPENYKQLFDLPPGVINNA